MNLPRQISLEAISDAARKPAATLAVVATLAAGVALESPVSAEAQTRPPDAPAAVSPKEQDRHQDELLPSLAVAGFMIASCAGGLYSIGRAMRDMHT